MSTLSLSPGRTAVSRPSGVNRLAALFMGMVMFMLSMVGLASASQAVGNDTNQAAAKLSTYVQSNMAGTEYELNGGGSVKGSTLFVKDPQTGLYTLDDYAYSKLSKAGQNAAAEDVIKYSKQAQDQAAKGGSNASSAVKGINNQTVGDYLKQFQDNPGFATKSMQTVLEGISPNYIAADKFITPFKGVFNTLLAILVILMFMMVVFTYVYDLCYINIPALRNNITPGEKSDKKGAHIANSLVSSAAKAAVLEAEQGDTGKSPLFGYIKRRFFESILLALCLVLLISGKILVVGAQVVDALSGVITSM